MTTELHKKFDDLEDVRLRINFQVASWTSDQFNQRPAEGKWSPAQVIFHLVQVEQFSVKYINKKMGRPETLMNAGIGSRIRFFLLKFFLSLPVKYKAPAPVATVPEILSKEELLMQWEETRKELAKFLDQYPVELLEKNIFRHLVAGRLNILQMLEFIHHHINHHLPQIVKSA